MTVSHKRTFFDNIGAFDDREIVRVVQRLLSSNRTENKRFDIRGFRKKLAEHLPEDRVERVMEAAMSDYIPTEGEKKVITTGADLASMERKRLKRNMSSRRKSR